MTATPCITCQGPTEWVPPADYGPPQCYRCAEAEQAEFMAAVHAAEARAARRACRRRYARLAAAR